MLFKLAIGSENEIADRVGQPDALVKPLHGTVI
jgi:hypothetical protein